MTNPLPNIEDLKPGIRPVGPRILVYPLPIDEKSDGGILLVKSLTEREDMAQVQALVLDFGNEAFEDLVENWADVGDTVLMAKYAGLYWTGTDGRRYRVINDADIVAVIESEDEQEIERVGESRGKLVLKGMDKQEIERACEQVCSPVGIESREAFSNG
ncbi:MAG: hypothetical protein MN733_12085 [Nitrososphaera sp.]|nr:hypothetical protein [Nitrososphaera sp.]